MATQVQFRRGTTAETASFTGASGEITVDLTKHVCVVHDAIQVGGYPLMLESGVNSALSLGTLSSCSLKFLNDPNTGFFSPGPDQLTLVTGGVARITIDSAGAISIPGNFNLGGDLNITGTGYLDLPVGTTAERPSSPNSGMVRFNNTLLQFEGYNGSAWGTIGGGATGGVGNSVFYENDISVTANYTLSANKNAVSAGPITINSGITVTVPSGQAWVIV